MSVGIQNAMHSIVKGFRKMPENNPLENQIEFAENPEPRCACVLLLDTSGSMNGAKIDAISSCSQLGRPAQSSAAPAQPAVPHRTEAARPAAPSKPLAAFSFVMLASRRFFGIAALAGPVVALLVGVVGLVKLATMPTPATASAAAPITPATPQPSTSAGKINPTDGAEMIFIPAGKFTMGSDDPDPFMSDSHPKHSVTLDGYYIYKNDVTVAMYKKFCDATGRAMPDPPPWDWDNTDYPMVNVSWDDAQAYANWAGVSLPTEAQWEKAARGTDGRRYPWGNRWDASKCAINRSEPAAVGSFPTGASPYGVLDMAGNVWDWCSDWYGADYYSHSPDKNPRGPDSGDDGCRVLRGGSWRNFVVVNFRCALRVRYIPENWDLDIGFRCVARQD